jgi:energy-coupling factor transporter ATP-binding protein EcfA2
MPYDYSQIFKSDSGMFDTWRDIYDDSLSLPENLLSILKRTTFLPHDFYDIITAYFLLPSALCRVVPYLFLYGQSGSGKSTLAKMASYLHGIDINSSSDTFAGIRNGLNERRETHIEISSDDPKYPSVYKKVERNTCMVWDDVDSTVFTNNPDIYRLFKFGYDRSTDKIVLSSDKVGENLEFRCFCPKVFSSISPLHLDDRFKELKRRLIVIPCKRIEELSDERRAEMGVGRDNWQSKLLDISAYDWKGFDKVFDEFWDYEMASVFTVTRKELSCQLRGLNSLQRAISLDLIATGVACGIWEDGEIALERLRAYWKWFKKETEENAGLSELLKQFIRQEERNAKNGNRNLEIYTPQVRGQVDMWVAQGWLYEKPRPREIKDSMLDLGMRLQQGRWIKG